MTKFLDKPVPEVPTPKTFWGWVLFALSCAGAIGIMTWGFLYMIDYSRELQEKTETKVTQLMSAYSHEGFNFDHSKSNGSMWGNVTLNISDGRGVHACRNISMDTLRDSAPINCSDGTVISAK